jgi:hypothetical protein
MPRPHKALVLSFHGWSGTGKNFVAQMLAENLYRDGLRSDCVKMFIAMFHFPHSQFVDLYKVRPGAAGEPRHPAAGATVKQTLLATLPCKKVGSREAGGGCGGQAAAVAEPVTETPTLPWHTGGKTEALNSHNADGIVGWLCVTAVLRCHRKRGTETSTIVTVLSHLGTSGQNIPLLFRHSGDVVFKTSQQVSKLSLAVRQSPLHLWLSVLEFRRRPLKVEVA